MDSKSSCSPPTATDPFSIMQIKDLSITPLDTKPTSSLDDEDVITTTLLPDLLLNRHSLFNKRHILPALSSTQCDWFFDVLPANFKKRYESCDSQDLEALEIFFWDSAQKIYDPLISTIEFYYVTLQACVFDSFVKEMELYCSTHHGVFILPITRVCNLMDWAFKYPFKYHCENHPPFDEEEDKIHAYHRHLIVVAQYGLRFEDFFYKKIRSNDHVMNSCDPLTYMLKCKAFNSVPITRLSDLLKVCSIQQVYDYDFSNYDDTYEFDYMDYIEQRMDMPPIRRVDSF